MNRRPSFCEGEAELARARKIVFRAWNVATYGVQLFETDSFNQEIDVNCSRGPL
jgi:hypothetical protein